MRLPGWRGLAVFWTAILLAVAVGGATLESLGPPARPMTVTVRTAPPLAATPPAPPAPPAPPQRTPPAPAASPATWLTPGRTTAGPINDPDPALLEPAKSGDGALLPRLDASGRAPMQAYARGFDQTTLRPRIGLILAGLGVTDAGGQDTVRTLPGGVTLAISPYALRPDRLLEAARIAGHEYLLSLPMESYADAANDAGDHALLTNASATQNAARLDWILSRFGGYAGVTNALGSLRGERFAGAAEPMAPVLGELAARGLFYVDARPVVPLPPGLWAVNVDVLVDDPAVRSEIDAKLALLEKLARQRGWALGLAATPRPVTIDRITDWANGLSAKGLVLAPASALVKLQPPATITGATK